MKFSSLGGMLLFIAVGCNGSSVPVASLTVTADVATRLELQEQWPGFEREMQEAGRSPAEIENTRATRFEKSSRDQDVLRPLADWAVPYVAGSAWADHQKIDCAVLAKALAAARTEHTTEVPFSTRPTSKAVQEAMAAGFNFDWAVLELTPGAVRMSGRTVMPLDAGSVHPEDLRDGFLMPLQDALAELAGGLHWIKQFCEDVPLNRGVLLIVDQGVPYTTVSQTMRTAGRSMLWDVTVPSPVEVAGEGWTTGSPQKLELGTLFKVPSW